MVEGLVAFLAALFAPAVADMPATVASPARHIAAPTPARPVIPRPLARSPRAAPPDLFPATCAARPPQEFRPSFVRAARRHPSLADACDLARQARQESGFRRDAVSPAGAIGISQFLPATAAQMGIDPWDPHESIHAQAKYLKWCQAAWTPGLGGRTDVDIRGLALGCYNYGRGAMYRHQRRYGWTLLCDAMPRLPAETRVYIERIEGPACMRR